MAKKFITIINHFSYYKLISSTRIGAAEFYFLFLQFDSYTGEWKIWWNIISIASSLLRFILYYWKFTISIIIKKIVKKLILINK